MHRMSREPGTFPHQTAFFGEKRWDFSADEFVGDGLFAVGIQLIRVGHVPCSAGASIVIALCGARCGEGSLLCVKGISVRILGRSDGGFAARGVDLEDGVVGAVDVGV